MAESNNKNGSLGGEWHFIQPTGQIPSARTDFASCVVEGKLYVFGGSHEVLHSDPNDEFWECCLETGVWQEVQVLSDAKPCARELSSFAVCSSSQTIYMFGGLCSDVASNDFWKFDIQTQRWTCIHERTSDDRTTADQAIHGRIPCGRFQYTSTVHNGKFILFGGETGETDAEIWSETLPVNLHSFDLETSKWTEINVEGTWPSARLQAAWTKDSRYLYIHGGVQCGILRGDVNPLSDFFALDLETYKWKELVSHGSAPSPRFGHSLCAYGDRFYLFFGRRAPFEPYSTDTFVYNIESGVWTKETQNDEAAPPARECCAVHVHHNTIYLFGGFVLTSDHQVLNDFYRYPLYPIHVPTTPIGRDLQCLVNSEEFSDVCFMVEGKVVYAHKNILAMRSEYFKTMFLGGWREAASGDRPIEISNVLHSTFVKVLEFLYSNEVQWGSLEEAKQLIIASDMFQLERLMVLCENWICKRLSNETVISILLESRHVRQATGLKKCAMDFLMKNWDDPVVKGHLSDLFEDLDLVHEVLQQKYNF